MRRTLVYGAATAAMALSLAGCAGQATPDVESIETVYGPPPVEEEGEVDEPIEDVYGAPPIDETIELFYGPPPVDEAENMPMQAFYGAPPTEDES